MPSRYRRTYKKPRRLSRIHTRRIRRPTRVRVPVIRGGKSATNAKIVVQIQDLNINYITNETATTSSIPSFSELKLSNLNTENNFFILDAKDRPMICENYRYEMSFLASRLKSYTDVLMFLYNENRHKKYVKEMVNAYSIPVTDREDANSQRVIFHNIDVTLQLMFSYYYQRSSMKQFPVTFTPIPQNAQLHKVIWLYELDNNPLFINMIRQSELYHENQSSNKNALTKTLQKHQSILNAHIDKITDTSPVISSDNFSGVYGNKRETQNTLVAVLKDIKSTLNTLKNSTDIPDAIATYESLLNTLKNFNVRVSNNYTDAALMEWIKTTIQFVTDVYVFTRNVQRTQLTNTSFAEYVNDRKNDPSFEMAKTTFPVYYSMMDELYSLSTRYVLDTSMIESLLSLENSSALRSGSEKTVLQYNSVTSGKSGYIVNIAIEFKTTAPCLDIDLKLGAYLKRNQNIRTFKYKPNYYLSDIVAPSADANAKPSLG